MHTAISSHVNFKPQTHQLTYFNFTFHVPSLFELDINASQACKKCNYLEEWDNENERPSKSEDVESHTVTRDREDHQHWEKIQWLVNSF